MAKRFTDTEKWKREWFRKLDSRRKLLWLYLCDACDSAGIWIEDFETASLWIGAPVGRDDYPSFDGRIVRLEPDKIFIPRFIEFQYGTLKESAPMHRKIIDALKKRNIDPVTLTLSENCKNHPVLRVGPTLEDKEEEEDKDKEEEEEKDRRGIGGGFSADPQGELRREAAALMNPPPPTVHRPPGWEGALTLEQMIAQRRAKGEDTSSLEKWLRTSQQVAAAKAVVGATA